MLCLCKIKITMQHRILFLVTLGISVVAYSSELPSRAVPSETVQILSTATNLSGISAVLRRVSEEDKIIVVDVIENGPAANAGLKMDDVISEIDSKSTSGEELQSVASRLRGAPGTEVRLTIDRSGARNEIKIIRDFVRLKDVVTPVAIIVKGNKYLIDGQEISFSMILTILNDRAGRQKNWPIKIISDNQASYPSVKSLLEKSKEAGLINVEISNSNE